MSLPADFAPHAPHSPATPAKWYESGTPCDTIISPRTPDYNYSGPVRTECSAQPPSGPAPFGHEDVWWFGGTNFSELTSCQPYFDAKDEAQIDDLAQKRCKALLSVDDSYAGIVSAF